MGFRQYFLLGTADLNARHRRLLNIERKIIKKMFVSMDDFA